ARTASAAFARSSDADPGSNAGGDYFARHSPEKARCRLSLIARPVEHCAETCRVELIGSGIRASRNFFGRRSLINRRAPEKAFYFCGGVIYCRFRSDYETCSCAIRSTLRKVVVATY